MKTVYPLQTQFAGGIKKSIRLKKVFFNYFDKKSQEAMLKISMEMQKSLFFI